MSLHARMRLDGDGVRTGERLPPAIALTIIPLAVYAFAGSGSATVTGWSMISGDGSSETWLSDPVTLRLVPSLWVFLLAIGIAVAAHLVARDRWAQDPVRAVDAKIAGVIAVWVVVGLAYFGGWAWLAAVGGGAVEASVPFPLMGYITAAAS
ncbi:hypothetical protein FQ330_01270 [Agrococcus sediminis]|uniref:Uncharacterized protein n=1 Tax=Agrococcus sediminis TaxID=2599924 RepID=A0A5M8QM98_9MICO|nr:hypothetical protein [Agrococcus sediminis]KAA6436090.1 hypothetical protein FQ330_01270 [Agrococcus sediminis]